MKIIIMDFSSVHDELLNCAYWYWYIFLIQQQRQKARPCFFSQRDSEKAAKKKEKNKGKQASEWKVLPKGQHFSRDYVCDVAQLTLTTERRYFKAAAVLVYEQIYAATSDDLSSLSDVRVLLCLQKNRKRGPKGAVLGLLGGKREDFDTSPAATAFRELWEESGKLIDYNEIEKTVAMLEAEESAEQYQEDRQQADRKKSCIPSSTRATEHGARRGEGDGQQVQDRQQADRKESCIPSSTRATEHGARRGEGDGQQVQDRHPTKWLWVEGAKMLVLAVPRRRLPFLSGLEGRFAQLSARRPQREVASLHWVSLGALLHPPGGGPPPSSGERFGNVPERSWPLPGGDPPGPRLFPVLARLLRGGRLRPFLLELLLPAAAGRGGGGDGGGGDGGGGC